MFVGYARKSTADQSLDLQIDALKAAGCTRIFRETGSGADKKRPELMRALAALGTGDVLVVWKLDRLARSLRHLTDIVTDLEAREVGFRALQDPIDLTTSQGKLIFHIMSALTEFEREIIRERTLAGLAAARARGRVGGRPRRFVET
ncbi:recombinase family protein [Parvularcula sp. LCG005]|uniref:recombinase family protein n=1 Tax=Parvularcula sp. LCG005 TaxID=3078805 RepID=UPI002941E05A|nr:recombinase family protein [Parvularcula sp. LCG005]WOI52996.1 recombinase family protein [Parvularcula sp. LCG005]